MQTLALIVAAGSGRRAGGGLPKQFRPCAGRPLLAHALERFAAAPAVTQIVLVLPDPDDLDRHLGGAAAWSRPVSAVAGGASRQDSVAAGLAAGGPCDLVLVHDGARPLVPVALIEAVARAAAETGAALAALPCGDTVKEAESGRVVRTLDRRRLVLAQTPQGFRMDLLKRAHLRAAAEGWEATDDAALVERLGAPVAVVPGVPGNLKVTTLEDLAMAEALLGLAAGKGPLP